MLPSILATEIRQSIRRFLVTAYEPADGFFHGVMQRFVDGPDGIGKGPYLQVGLPFRVGVAGCKFFDTFDTQHPGYIHQEAAWRRLRSDRKPANTLIATGTGSGKTECFLYPVLDHCIRARASGQVKGIKALLIYPMNALAMDQARRFAEWIAKTPACRDLRVGMYVGGGGGRPGSGVVMTPTTVITDRDTLRKAPPDILLTNYKMLDYLLVRPRDRALWAHNGPEVLRYVVVDELHTFDGAQGTDLALLLRRLRARLATPADHLLCIGTSATLGDGDTAPLREYARQIFSSLFEPDSVIGEDRDNDAQFLGDDPIMHVLQGRPDIGEILDPAGYRTPEAAIAEWFPLFFPGEVPPEDPADAAWRGRLGKQLKQHLLTHNLLRVLKGGIGSWATLRDQLAGPMPEAARAHAGRVLDALVSLIAWARDPNDPARPLVTVRVQLWVRELRRMVASVRAHGADVELRSSADLKATIETLHLPLVQCSDCHTSGWLARRPSGDARLDRDLETIYNAWFHAAPDVARLYPVAGVETPQCEARKSHLCCRCGALQDASEACSVCGHDETIEVWDILATRQSNHNGMTSNWHDKVCPACGSVDRLLLLGARNATLGAQLIEQSWATPYNDDKKLIAFSDSVQDAAHRAGFFGGRTYLNNVRMAMTRVLEALAQPTVNWPEYLEKLPAHWLEPGRLSAESFVTEFIGPNMTWQHEWDPQLLTSGRLPADSDLLKRVRKRLAWQAVSEFTYLSRRGRTLERMGIATLSLPADALDGLAKPLAALFAERFGLRDVQDTELRQWLWGWLIRLRQRGGVSHPEMVHYAREGDLYVFRSHSHRDLWLPPLSQYGPHPVFLSLGKHRGFDRLASSPRKTWYQQWLFATLGHGRLLPKGIEEDLYTAAIDALLAEGILVAEDGTAGRSIALNADRMVLDTVIAQLLSERGRRALTVPAALANLLDGMPCLDAMQERYTRIGTEGASAQWIARRFREGAIRRVIAAEHTSLLAREEREALETRFKAPPDQAKPWFENLLSATPTLEMGVDIGNLSSVLLCSVPPTQASFLQRIGRAGRHDGNAMVVTLADGASPHDLYFYAQPEEMMAGQVSPPGVFLQAAEVLRRQLLAFCIDAWVASGIQGTAFPDKTSVALDAIDANDQGRFPYNLLTFIQKDEESLLDRFLALLGDDLQPRAESRLRDYMVGRGDQDGLRIGLLKALEELSRERAAHRRRASDTKNRIKELRALPQDDSTANQISELNRERDAALEQSREIGARALLGTLTDAGLIPNYAFPEAGIELKSLLWRRRADGEDGHGAYVTLPAERYERPAASALSEFAPENRFYANQHRFEINQINMQLAKIEEWRLCPACHHVENLGETGDAHAACPRCGDPMWANVLQRRNLLRFKQAMANANDAKSRIDDSSEDREPRFFQRQLLVDFEPDAVEIAWQVESEGVAFGFEFVRRAEFRDINFGELGKKGEAFRVADRDATRPGFKLCRHCGRVQTPPRRRRDGKPAPAQTHARDCLAFGTDDQANILDCLYLYREFSSEALRILVPYTRSGLDEVVLQSFMAALQLGLKRRFGGRVDHLRITPQEEPGKDGAPRRQYVLLYDSVPGGTGYLHQLLSQDAQTLTEVLELAFELVQACSCRNDPDKDGCYRCVYQYRQGRAMAKVSRRVAAEVLGELVEALPGLERVKSISGIFLNPRFDSVLESRFIESLRRLSSATDKSNTNALPTVRVIQEVVQGKSGYLLEVGDERYWVRPQVDIGPEQGVVVAVRPDFLIVPVRSTSSRRPIAVFADGWAYHKDGLREDARKRSALVSSARYWVWSVTWEDVETALAGSIESDLVIPGPHGRLAADHPFVAGAASGLEVRAADTHENAVARLLRWLALPSDAKCVDPADQRCRRQAAALAARLVAAHGSQDDILAGKCIDAVAKALPDGCNDLPSQRANAASVPGKGACTVSFAWPKGYLTRDFSQGFGAVLLGTAQATDPEALKAGWREWLAWFNLLQTLPNMFLLEEGGVAHGDYQDLGGGSSTGGIADGGGSKDAWTVVVAQCLGEMRDGLIQLRIADVPAPSQVGYEHESSTGEVIAEAELAWPEHRLVVLAPGAAGHAAAWDSLGWNVVRSDDPAWAESVLTFIRSEVS